MSDRLSAWKSKLVSIGIFVIFVIEFGEFVVKKVWFVIEPLF